METNMSLDGTQFHKIVISLKCVFLLNLYIFARNDFLWCIQAHLVKILMNFFKGWRVRQGDFKAHMEE